MRDYSIHIKSPDAGNIYVNGKFVGFIDNIDTFFIDLKVYCNTLVITKEPESFQKKLLLPYTVKLNFTNGKINCDSDFVKVVPYIFAETDVILKECEVKSYKPVEKIYDNVFGDTNIVVVNDGSSYINIYENEVSKFSYSLPELTKVMCEKETFLKLKGISANNKYYILILDNNYNVIFNDEADKIEESDTEIKILQKINDIAKHARVTVINLTDATKNNYYVYLNSDALTVNNNKIIPYAFMEAVKVNNYNLARTYLDDNLKHQTDDAHLKAFFTNLKNIYYNNYNINENLINYTVEFENTFKSLNFSILNNKIIEIEETEL